jgi:hypothetical protein
MKIKHLMDAMAVLLWASGVLDVYMMVPWNDFL